MTMFLCISYDYVFEYRSSCSAETATGSVLQKKMFLKISQISLENTAPVLESLFNKFAAVTLLKRDSNRVFSCEICEFFENTYFEERLQTRANDCFWQCSGLVINLYMMNAFPIGFIVRMMYAFLKRHFYTRCIKLSE